MTIKTLIEFTQQHFPDMGEAEIIKLLNRAQNGLAVSSGLLSDKIVVYLKKDDPYYSLDDNIISITSVNFKNNLVPRLITTSVDGINFFPDQCDDLITGDVSSWGVIDIGETE